MTNKDDFSLIGMQIRLTADVHEALGHAAIDKHLPRVRWQSSTSKDVYYKMANSIV